MSKKPFITKEEYLKRLEAILSNKPATQPTSLIERIKALAGMKVKATEG